MAARLDRGTRIDHRADCFHGRDRGAQSGRREIDSRVPGARCGPTPTAASPASGRIFERPEGDSASDDQAGASPAARIRAANADAEGTSEGRSDTNADN